MSRTVFIVEVDVQGMRVPLGAFKTKEEAVSFSKMPFSVPYTYYLVEAPLELAPKQVQRDFFGKDSVLN